MEWKDEVGWLLALVIVGFVDWRWVGMVLGVFVVS